MNVVEQRRHPGEADGAEELFLVQRAIGLAELSMAFMGEFPEFMIERHVFEFEGI